MKREEMRKIEVLSCDACGTEAPYLTKCINCSAGEVYATTTEERDILLTVWRFIGMRMAVARNSISAKTVKRRNQSSTSLNYSMPLGHLKIRKLQRSKIIGFKNPLLFRREGFLFANLL